ncbi:MAG: DUF2071 domain-containing protein [Verrucomicrobia bacterium]|nr:DUF2071 domain-containing protein [Verrucomicrobiota bacterium]
MDPGLVNDGVKRQLRERQYPAAPMVMRQRWLDLLFLHWRWDPAEVQRTLPPGLTVDTWDGNAWIGVVPFAMRGVRPRFCPSVPGVSHLLELNLRTYVLDRAGRPGVWFYSLDASQPLAVWAARAFFALHYYHARMELSVADGECRFVSCRAGTAQPLRYHYRPEPAHSRNPGHSHEAMPGTLEFFLVERYRLFAFRRGRVLTGRVYHRPYPLTAVETSVWNDGLFALDGFNRPNRPPDHQIYASQVEVSIFAPEAVPG